jgi:RNA polymerase sigma-70 factor, ECF subfamily
MAVWDVKANEELMDSAGLDECDRQRDGAPDDGDLLAKIAEGDRLAFRTLMERHTPAMLALAERTTGSAADADDMVQEAFLKVWNMAPDWRADGPARFSTWLYRVVLNSALDRRRRKTALPLEDAGHVADGGPCGLHSSMALQRRHMVLDAMAELPDRQRSALSLYYFSEVHAPEAARILGLSLSAVEALIVRGKRALRKSLARRGITGLEDVQ